MEFHIYIHDRDHGDDEDPNSSPNRIADSLSRGADALENLVNVFAHFVETHREIAGLTKKLASGTDGLVAAIATNTPKDKPPDKAPGITPS